MNNQSNYPSLQHKHIFITGGASGIGAALVQAFAGQGAKVSFVDIDNSSAENLLTELSNQQTAENAYLPKYYECDVTATEALIKTIKDAGAADNNIDVLINNVANDQRFQTCQMTSEQWRQSMAVNLDPVFFAAQNVQSMMQENGGGSIINFSSINALLGPENMPSYITAKAAILGLTKSLARDFGGDNIRVNAILPGWVVTDKQLEKWLTPEAEKEWLAQLCIKKRIFPEDVAKLALFLASDDAALITSQEFVIDAGRT